MLRQYSVTVPAEVWIMQYLSFNFFSFTFKIYFVKTMIPVPFNFVKLQCEVSNWSLEFE